MIPVTFDTVATLQLDENGCVKVDRRDSGKTGGQWMLSAESPDGKVSYSRIGKYVTPMEVTQ